MYIKEKRGVWYVIDPPKPKMMFESEKLAKAHVKRVAPRPVEPKKSDDDWSELV
jgi:hypothetical protein|tara:strand:+ start:1160 stop:1321 length:162 start_codon:yes stop_codon:yes gene_type:complete